MPDTLPVAEDTDLHEIYMTGAIMKHVIEWEFQTLRNSSEVC